MKPLKNIENMKPLVLASAAAVLVSAAVAIFIIKNMMTPKKGCGEAFYAARDWVKENYAKLKEKDMLHLFIHSQQANYGDCHNWPCVWTPKSFERAKWNA